MRIGIFAPWTDKAGTFLNSRQLAEQAQMIEAAGIDAIWHGEHLPVPGMGERDFPDLLMLLLICAHATDHVELSTGIYALPLRNRNEAARDFYTLQTLAPDRFTFGIGTSSQRREWESADLDWDTRFARLREHMTVVRAILEGRPLDQLDDEAARTPSWGRVVGSPRFVLGAWHSDPQLKIAVNEYDGWMASAGPGSQFGGWRKVFTEGIKRYRDLGGKRAMIATTPTDLKMPDAPLADDGPFNLHCGPKEAAERLNIVAEMGFDDILLFPSDHTAKLDRPYTAHLAYSTEELELFRSLLPKDARDYREL